MIRRNLLFALLVLLIWLGSTVARAANPPELNANDLALINRLSWGVDLATAVQYQQLGSDAWLEQQLRGTPADLPPDVQQRIDAMPISNLSMQDLILERRQLEQQIRNTSNADAVAAMRKAANQSAEQLIIQSSERRILRALYSPAQLQEVMTWFWFNHFNVFRGKALDSLLIADYEEHAIRPHVLGKFRDLVWGTLTHPAMLLYLDNQQNAVNASNENYARELMELHTLGVNAGYTQADVQALARILTGVRFRLPDHCPAGQNALEQVPVSDISPLFCFAPALHDNSEKRFLNQDFPAGAGRAEVSRAVDMLIDSPATAQHISRELAVYFLGDNPPDAVVDAMARRFVRSDGDIAQTLAVLLHSDAFRSGKYFGKSFKDPVHYVLSSVRLLYDDAPIQNVRPVVGWINQLGEGFYDHVSPDGYSLVSQDWLSADQLSKRLDIAKGIYWGAGALYTDESITQQLDNTDKAQLQDLRQKARQAHPIDSFDIYDLMRPMLSEQTQATLKQSLSFDEWNSLLLSSPEFMYH